MPPRSIGCCAITPRAVRTAETQSGACSTSSCGTAPSSTKTEFKRCPMRMLWLKSDLLLPLDKGGRLRTWHLMRHLARRHQITYLCFVDPDQPRADVDGMHAAAERVVTVPRRDPPKRSWRFYADALAHVLDPLPYAVGKYRSRPFRRRLAEVLAEQAFDLIV